MTNFLKTNILLLLTACCLQSNAQTISSDDQKGTEATYNAFMAAFQKMDGTALPSLLTENAEQIVPSGQLVRGRANVVANMNGYMEFLKTQPKPDQVDQKNLLWQSRYLAADVILSTYIDETVLHFGDKTQTEKMTTAVVLRKVNGQWLLEMLSMTPAVEMPKN